MEVKIIGLAGADVVRLLTIELEIGLEFAVTDFGIDFADDGGVGFSLALEGGFQTRDDTVDIMLIYLSLYFIGSYGIDLADLGAGGDALTQDDVQQAQFTVDGGFHDEVAFAPANHRHIQLHILQRFLHTVDLCASIKTVLPGAFRHQIVLLQSQIVVFLGLQVVFLGDEIVLVEGLLLLVGSLETVNLCTVLQHILTHVQLLLLHLDLGVAENVLLLGQLRL